MHFLYATLEKALIWNASKTRDLHLIVNFIDRNQKDGRIVQDSKIGLRGGIQKCKEIVLYRNYWSQIIVGHDVNADIEDVPIITFLPWTTAKNQPLDLGLIGNCKMRYRAFLLRATIKTMEARKEDQINTRKIRGMYGIDGTTE